MNFIFYPEWIDWCFFKPSYSHLQSRFFMFEAIHPEFGIRAVLIDPSIPILITSARYKLLREWAHAYFHNRWWSILTVGNIYIYNPAENPPFWIYRGIQSCSNPCDGVFESQCELNFYPILSPISCPPRWECSWGFVTRWLRGQDDLDVQSRSELLATESVKGSFQARGVYHTVALFDLSIDRSIDRSIYLSIDLSIHLSIYLLYLSIYCIYLLYRLGVKVGLWKI